MVDSPAIDRLAVVAHYGIDILLGIPEIEQELFKLSTIAFPKGQFVLFGSPETHEVGVIAQSGINPKTGEVSLNVYSHPSGHEIRKVHFSMVEKFDKKFVNYVEYEEFRDTVLDEFIEAFIITRGSIQLRTFIGYLYMHYGTPAADFIEEFARIFYDDYLPENIIGGLDGYCDEDRRLYHIGEIVGFRIKGDKLVAVVSGLQPLQVTMLVDGKIEIVEDALKYDLTEVGNNEDPDEEDFNEEKMAKELNALIDGLFVEGARNSVNFYKVKAVLAAIVYTYGIAGKTYVMSELPEMFRGLDSL
jgi:hypothetical protein